MNIQSTLKQFIYLSCISVAFSSCFTTEMLDKAELDRKPEKIREVHSAYFDSSHELVINFKAKLDGSWKYQPYHIKVNVDTPIMKYSQPRVWVYEPTKKEKEEQHLNMVYHNYIKKERKACIGIEYNKNVLAKGFLLDQGDSTNKKASIKIYRDKDISVRAKKNLPQDLTEKEINARHSFLVIEPDSIMNARMGKEKKYVSINLEPSSKRRYDRYLLLPATSIADIITSPFQVVGILLERTLSKFPMM